MQKKQPVRMCSGCAAHRPKRELVRVVRTPEGTILLDPGGKKSGRRLSEKSEEGPAAGARARLCDSRRGVCAPGAGIGGDAA